jgi:hypothetical protein
MGRDDQIAKSFNCSIDPVGFGWFVFDRIFELKLKFAAEAAESNIARPCPILMLGEWGVRKMFEK